MTLSTQKLVNSRVLVTGTDVLGTTGSTVLDSAQWEEVGVRKNVKDAQHTFDEKVSEFFAPLDAAFDELAQAGKLPEKDDLSVIVLDEPTTGVAAKPGHKLHLSHDSIVLRLLEQGDHDRLVWVNDTLEVLDSAPATTATPSGGAAVEVEEL